MLVSDDTVSSNASSSLPPGVLARAITSSASCNPTRAAISAAEGGAKRSSIFLKNIVALGRRKKEGTRDSLCKFNEMMRDIKRCCVCMVGENGISQQHVFEGWANHYAYLRFPLF